MTLRTFAGLGALLPSIGGPAPLSTTNAGVGEVLAAPLCLTLAGFALRDGNTWSPCGAGGSAIQIERGNYL